MRRMNQALVASVVATSVMLTEHVAAATVAPYDPSASPTTGIDVAGVTLAGGASLGAGALLLMLVRRRRPQTA